MQCIDNLLVKESHQDQLPAKLLQLLLPVYTTIHFALQHLQLIQLQQALIISKRIVVIFSFKKICYNKTEARCCIAIVGLARMGTRLSAASKVATTLAIDACASNITSTSFDSCFNASPTILSCVAVSPLINASKAPSHNRETNSISLLAAAALLLTRSVVGSSVVDKVAITPILLPVCTAWSAIG